MATAVMAVAVAFGAPAQANDTIEVGLKTRMFGGGMVGLQFASIMTALGPKLNGIVNYDF